MSGVSEMIPFVVIGGIGIAIAFMFGIFASDPTHETYNPIAGFFGQLGGDSAFKLFIPILAGFIAKSIAGRQGLLCYDSWFYGSYWRFRVYRWYGGRFFNRIYSLGSNEDNRKFTRCIKKE